MWYQTQTLRLQKRTVQTCRYTDRPVAPLGCATHRNIHHCSCTVSCERPVAPVGCASDRTTQTRPSMPNIALWNLASVIRLKFRCSKQTAHVSCLRLPLPHETEQIQKWINEIKQHNTRSSYRNLCNETNMHPALQDIASIIGSKQKSGKQTAHVFQT